MLLDFSACSLPMLQSHACDEDIVHLLQNSHLEEDDDPWIR